MIKLIRRFYPSIVILSITGHAVITGQGDRWMRQCWKLSVACLLIGFAFALLYMVAMRIDESAAKKAEDSLDAVLNMLISFGMSFFIAAVFLWATL